MQSSCGCSGCPNRANPGLPACEFCKKAHCIQHMLPEVHGCRDAAKNAARMYATKDARDVLEGKKAHDTKELRDKLAKKREELARQREKKKS